MIKRVVYCLLVLQFLSFSLFAQDDTEEETTSGTTFTKEELMEEQRYLGFKAAFIESIKQKSIENYDKALESLSVCENIYPENIPMLFEKAKNHLALKQTIEAHHYCDKALAIESDNFWIMALSRDIYEKEFNYEKAIEIQKELYAIKKYEAQNLLRLYYRTKNIEKGLALISDIKKNNISVLNIAFYEKYFDPKAKNELKKLKANTQNIEASLDELKEAFKQNKEYVLLQKILEKETANKQYHTLLLDSDTGLSLFPAQAKIYLYKGIALNGLGKFKEATAVLESGLDFVFDNATLTRSFYNALIIAYTGTNNLSKVNHYKQLVQKL